MRALVLSLLLPVLFLPAPALAQISEDYAADVEDDEEAPRKRDFSFAQPGKTATRTALSYAGKAKRDYEGRVIQGEMDALVCPSPDGKDDPLLVQRARGMGKGLSYVHVLEYDEPTGRHTLVFKDDILWYAIFPTRAGETKPDEVARRYGDAPKTSAQRRKIEGTDHTARIHWFHDSGVAFVQLDGAETYAYKMVYAPKQKR